MAGLFVMLPDDLENLAASAVATTLFSNNILQAITTRDYWNVANEFKPLMHTWSLGIEEQYYFFYPVLFLLFSGKRLRFILPLLVILTVASFAIYLMPFFSNSAKFYYMPFRFFELSCGGISAILLKDGILNKKNAYLSALCLSIVVLIIMANITSIPDSVQLFLIVAATCGLIVFTEDGKNLSCVILQNKSIVFIGTISFSLYMWHQPLIVFVRYFMMEEVTASTYFAVFVITFVLSVLSYFFIEQPFRNKKIVSGKLLFATLVPTNIVILGLCMFLYSRAGIIRDVPELDIVTTKITRGLHAAYNHRVYSYNRGFTDDDKICVLVVGNSFARDFVNILIESKWNDKIEISYYYLTDKHDLNGAEIISRITTADLVFYSTLDRNRLDLSPKEMEKVFCLGTKNFGKNSGYYYNYRGNGYYDQRAKMKEGIRSLNNHLKEQWGKNFVDLIGYVVDSDNTVPVFTHDRKFISQDCLHLTKAGAQYFAKLLENDKEFILNRYVVNTEKVGYNNLK